MDKMTVTTVTPIWKTKTFWTMVLALVGMAGNCVIGEGTWGAMREEIMIAIGLITVRDKMVKQGTGL